jgi:hypothetical protein
MAQLSCALVRRPEAPLICTDLNAAQLYHRAFLQEPSTHPSCGGRLLRIFLASLSETAKSSLETSYRSRPKPTTT